MPGPKIGNIGFGGAGISEGNKGDSGSLKELLTAVRDELDDIRTKYAAVLAKLDADAGVTDTNYASTQALAATKFDK